MKFFSLLALVGALSLSTLQAGRLDLAVVQFPALLAEEDLSAALQQETLVEIIVGDRLQSRQSILRGGLVLFAQSLTVSSSTANVSNITRIGNKEASVEGVLQGRKIQLDVSLAEGVDAPLKRFSRRVHSGQGALQAGAPRILGFRQIESRTPVVVKGKSKTVTTLTTNLLVYQYQP
jgi:hypothetical protein